MPRIFDDSEEEGSPLRTSRSKPKKSLRRKTTTATRSRSKTGKYGGGGDEPEEEEPCEVQTGDVKSASHESVNDCECEQLGTLVKDLSSPIIKKSECLKQYWRCGSYLAIAKMLCPFICLFLLLFFLYHTRCYFLPIVWPVLEPFQKVLSVFVPSCWFKSTEQRINEAIERYHADQIGIADYALESTGGTVLCNSDTYYSKSGAFYALFGIPIWYSSTAPSEVIRPNVHPGNCWAMDGDHGFVTIQLRVPVVARSVSVEHIPRQVAPTDEDQNSALKDFQVTGREEDMSSPELFLGNFTYEKAAKPLQQFHLIDSDCANSRFPGSWCGANNQQLRVVTLRIFNNHGNPNFTCIYRFRVHGPPIDDC